MTVFYAGAKPGARKTVTYPQEVSAGMLARTAAGDAQAEHGSSTGEQLH